MMHYIVANLTETYPQDSSASILLNLDTEEWMFNNHGGAMGAMYIIHASITEYLIIYGTPLGTEGHTGIHTADDYFNILVGEEWLFSPPNLTMTVYKPGDLNLMPRGSSPKQYKMHKGCFALEYARGKYIFLFLSLAIADSSFLYRMDPSYASVRLCRFIYLNTRFLYALENNQNHWKRDASQSINRKDMIYRVLTPGTTF